MIYTTNRIERFNNTVRRKIKIRRWLPDENAVYKLIFASILEQQNWAYSYKIAQISQTKEKLEKMLEKIYH